MPAGDPVYAEDVEFAEQAPIGRCVASGTQALSDTVTSALAFSVEDFDSHNQHSTVTNNSRITPNVPGIYEFRGTFFMSSMVSGVSVTTGFRLNGSTNVAPHPINQVTGSTPSVAVSVTIFQPMNGTTDYVELMATEDSAAGAELTNQSIQFSSVIEWRRVRALI